MMRQRINREIKQRLIDAHLGGEDYQETALVLGIKRGTAYSIVQRYIVHGAVERPRGGARRLKMDEEMTNTIVQIVELHPEFTLEQIQAELQARLPDKPHVSTL